MPHFVLCWLYRSVFTSKDMKPHIVEWGVISWAGEVESQAWLWYVYHKNLLQWLTQTCWSLKEIFVCLPFRAYQYTAAILNLQTKSTLV